MSRWIAPGSILMGVLAFSAIGAAAVMSGALGKTLLVCVFAACLIVRFSPFRRRAARLSSSHVSLAMTGSQKRPEFSRERDPSADWPEEPFRQDDVLVRVMPAELSDTVKAPAYRLPTAPLTQASQPRWVSSAETVALPGVDVAGGFFYVGSPRQSQAHTPDGCVINPLLTLAVGQQDVGAGPSSYWLSWQEFTPAQRSAYLQWLASDRTAPGLHENFLRFYIYGLERRVYIDGRQEGFDVGEYALIADELKRVKACYVCATPWHIDQLLDVITVVATYPRRQYQVDPDSANFGGYALPLSVRVTFGQCAVDRAPVPVEWALAWALHDPAIPKRTAVTRCGDVFAKLFRENYKLRFGTGLLLSANKAKLKVTPKLTSPALQNVMLPMWIGTLPDIAAINGPRNKLATLVASCAVALEDYSRYLGRYPDRGASFEGVLTLPLGLWPAHLRAALDELVTEIGQHTVVSTMGALLARFDAIESFARDRALVFAQLLMHVGIAIEPDIRLGGKVPKADDAIALYPLTDGRELDIVDDRYRTAALSVDLCAALACADSAASLATVAAIDRQIDAWSTLNAVQRTRLKARAAIHIAQPATLASFRKPLAALPADVKSALAAMMIDTANADGAVSPGKVKWLEKAYRLLDVAPERLYSDLHAHAASGGAGRRASLVSRSLAHTGERGASTLMSDTVSNTVVNALPGVGMPLALDSARIKALQIESAAVSALLAEVFSEEDGASVAVPGMLASAAPVETGSAAIAPSSTGLAPLDGEEAPLDVKEAPLGLDADHALLLRRLLAREQWTRAELLDLAEELNLMLDGAIEQINEAALDHWDEPLTDGDDPVEINQAFVQRLAA